jgi:ATP-dependent exoDNAse (exonuclease V) alpha subunit
VGERPWVYGKGLGISTADGKQLDAIEHGGVLRYLSRPQILGTARIETIRRQRETWARQAAADLRDGNALAALRAHHERGQVEFAESKDAAQLALIERWQQCRDTAPVKSRLVLAQRWRDVHELSERIRAIHRSEGSVATSGITLNCIVGEQIVRLEFALGDRVRFTRNDYRLGLTNGAMGTLVNMIEHPDGWEFLVRGDDDRTRRFTQQDYSDEHGRLQMIHAYASTIYAAQGLTVDETFVLHDVQMDRAAGYVAGSRHRDQCHWVCNRKALDELHPANSDHERLTHVAKSLSENHYQTLALERWERLPQVQQLVNEHGAEPERA